MKDFEGERVTMTHFDLNYYFFSYKFDFERATFCDIIECIDCKVKTTISKIVNCEDKLLVLKISHKSLIYEIESR